MTRSRSVTFLAGAAVIPLTALVAAGGASSSGATAAAASPPAPKATSARTATVRVANSHLGKILVNSHGHTLYLFKRDSRGKSACFGQCATFWPPLRASGKPTAGSGVKASALATIKRSDGKPQVTYHGHPLYTFSMDTKAGQTNGEGVNAFGARWFAISPAGKQVSPKAAATPAPAPTPAPPVPQYP
jgi:predicted lipoprotein with Yx(FWY)xxD motif